MTTDKYADYARELALVEQLTDDDLISEVDRLFGPDMNADRKSLVVFVARKRARPNINAVTGWQR